MPNGKRLRLRTHVGDNANNARLSERARLETFDHTELGRLLLCKIILIIMVSIVLSRSKLIDWFRYRP